MEWVTYFMIVLIAFATCFGWPVLINYEDFDEPVGPFGDGSARSVPSIPDPSSLEKKMDEPGGTKGAPVNYQNDPSIF